MKIRWMFLVVAMDFVSEQLLFFFYSGKHFSNHLCYCYDKKIKKPIKLGCFMEVSIAFAVLAYVDLSIL